MADFDQSRLEDRASALIAAALKAGAEAADAVAVRGMSQGVEVREGSVEESERSEGDDMGLRAFVGTRSAIVSTNAMDPAGFAALAERAVAMARVAPENPDAVLAERDQLAKNFAALDMLDETQVATETLIEWAQAAEAAAMSHPDITKSGGASASTGLGGMVLATSNGFSGAYLRSRFSISMTAIGGDGTGMERDYDWSSAVYLSDLENPETVGNVAAQRTASRLSPRKLSTRKAPVIFDNRMGASLLSDLAGAINGASIVRGASFLKDNLEDSIFPETIQVSDNPLIKRGLGSKPFDGEGLECKPFDIIKDGRLMTWILDITNARQLGLVSNGRASRGVSSAPSPSTTNLNMENGVRALEDLMKDAGSGLLITSMFGRGVNLVTGDYSRGVSGHWFENGAIAYPVSEITIAGHLREMFANLVPANDRVIRGATNAPSLLVGEMTIAGE